MAALNFIDVFAGAGGLSEGFIQEGFNPIAHVEMNKEACDTLKTRMAFHYLKKHHKEDTYNSYLEGNITRENLWKKVPENLMKSVINMEISTETINHIYSLIDEQLKGKKVDVFVGGPPCQAYSLVGRSRDPHGMRNDKRNYLFRFYAEFLDKYKPTYFVFENVLGLLSAGSRTYLHEMLDKFKEINTRHRDSNIKAILAYSIFFPFVELVLAISLGLLVWWVAEEQLQPGLLIMFILCINQIFRPLRIIADKFNVIQMGMVAADRVFVVLENNDSLQTT